MALIQAEVDLANQSLGEIGAKQVTLVSILAKTRPEDVQVNLHFVQTRNALLRSFAWPFAKTRIRLVGAWVTLTSYTTDQYVWVDDVLYKAASVHDAGTFATDLAAGKWTVVDITPTPVFGFNYDVPADFVRLIELNDELVHDFRGHHHHHRSHHHFHDWSLETKTILTDLKEIDILYIDKVTDTTRWDSLFIEVFILKLALKLIGPLTGMGTAVKSTKDDIRLELRPLMKLTRTIGRQEGNNTGRQSYNVARRVRTVGKFIHNH